MAIIIQESCPPRIPAVLTAPPALRIKTCRMLQNFFLEGSSPLCSADISEKQTFPCWVVLVYKTFPHWMAPGDRKEKGWGWRRKKKPPGNRFTWAHNGTPSFLLLTPALHGTRPSAPSVTVTTGAAAEWPLHYSHRTHVRNVENI